MIELLSEQEITTFKELYTMIAIEFCRLEHVAKKWLGHTGRSSRLSNLYDAFILALDTLSEDERRGMMNTLLEIKKQSALKTLVYYDFYLDMHGGGFRDMHRNYFLKVGTANSIDELEECMQEASDEMAQRIEETPAEHAGELAAAIHRIEHDYFMPAQPMLPLVSDYEIGVDDVSHESDVEEF